MDRPKEVPLDAPLKNSAFGAISSSTPNLTSNERVKSDVDVPNAADVEKDIIRSAEDVLNWRGRSRRFSLGASRHAMEQTRNTPDVRLQLDGLNAWHEVDRKTSTMELQETDSNEQLGVGHVKASQENLYFHRLCGSMDSDPNNTTARDRHSENAERATSMAVMLSHRYGRPSTSSLAGSTPDILRLRPRGHAASVLLPNLTGKIRQTATQIASSIGQHRGALSPTSSSSTRPKHISRSFSSPYFHSWSFGNIDVSHQVRFPP